MTESLTKLGHQVIDVSHIQNLVRGLVAGEAKGRDLVFNVREGVFGSAKEVPISAFLEANREPYMFSLPMRLVRR